MTKRRMPTLEEEFDALIEELPPMDQDATEIHTADDIVDEFAKELEIEDDFAKKRDAAADGEETPLESDFFDYEDLVDASGSSWIDEAESGGVDDLEVGAEVEDQSWIDDADEGVDGERELDLEDEWFYPENEKDSISGDDGAEGPLESDTIPLDDERKLWDELGDEEADSLEEELDSLEVLGVEFSEGETELGVRYSAGFVLDKQFLGPEDGGVVDVCFSASTPIAVGEGLFIIGADGLFHGIRGSHWLEKVLATSVCAFEEKIFIGTQSEGAFITEDQGRTLTPINKWYTGGLAAAKGAALERFSTAISLTGQQIDRGYRLYGRAGAGQLFASDDFGQSWRGPLIRGRCRAMACVFGARDFIAVVEAPDARGSIMRYDGSSAWEKWSIPENLEQMLLRGSLSMAAHGTTVLVGVDEPSYPLYETRDMGKNWHTIASLKGVSALAVDPDEPSCVVAATHDTEEGASTVHFSEDGGHTWQAVALLTDESSAPLDGGPSSREGQPNGEVQAVRSEPVRAMSVDLGKERRVLAVKGERVFVVTLARPGVAH